MIKNDELKKILQERNSVIEYAKSNFNDLKMEADNSEIKKYGTICDALGRFCPSLIEFKRIGNAKKGRYLKEKPQNRKYVVYECNKNGIPKRLRKYNEYGCTSSVYFFSLNGYMYSVPFIGETNTVNITAVYRYAYENGHIMNYCMMNRSQLVYEKYDYESIRNGYISCYLCDYLDSSFVCMSNFAIDIANKKLQSYGINRCVKSDSDLIERNEFCYKIFLKENQIDYVEEYTINNGNAVFIKNI